MSEYTKAELDDYVCQLIDTAQETDFFSADSGAEDVYAAIREHVHSHGIVVKREPEDFGMYTPAGNQAVEAGVLAAVSFFPTGKPGALERGLDAWAKQRDAIAAIYPEVNDTAVYEQIAATLQKYASAVPNIHPSYSEDEFGQAWLRWCT